MRLGKVVLGTVLALAGPAAEARQAGVVLAPNPVFSLADAWYAAGCDPDYEHGSLNRRDSIVATYHGQAFQLQWSERLVVRHPPFEVEAIGADCQKIGLPVLVTGSGGYYLLPAATRWVVVHNRGAVDASVMLS